MKKTFRDLVVGDKVYCSITKDGIMYGASELIIDSIGLNITNGSIYFRVKYGEGIVIAKPLPLELKYSFNITPPIDLSIMYKGVEDFSMVIFTTKEDLAVEVNTFSLKRNLRLLKEMKSFVTTT